MKQESLHRNIFKKAIRVFKKNPSILVLGFFAACLGNGGDFDFLVFQFDRISNSTFSLKNEIFSFLGTGGNNIFYFFDFTKLTGFLFVFSLLFLIFFVWVILSSQGALVLSVAKEDERESFELKRAFFEGSSKFFHLLFVFFFIKSVSIFLFLFLVLFFSFLFIYIMPPLYAFAISIFAIGVPVIIFSSLIYRYSISYVMIESKTWLESVSAAFKVFFSNWLVSIELSFLLFVLNFLFGFFILLSVMAVYSPLLFVEEFFYNKNVFVSEVVYFARAVSSFGILIFLGSILSTFQYSCVVELFLKIRKKKAPSKIMRLASYKKSKRS